MSPKKQFGVEPRIISRLIRSLCARPFQGPPLTGELETNHFGFEMTTFKILYQNSSPSPVKQMHLKYEAIMTAEALSIAGIVLICYSLYSFIR